MELVGHWTRDGRPFPKVRLDVYPQPGGRWGGRLELVDEAPAAQPAPGPVRFLRRVKGPRLRQSGSGEMTGPPPSQQLAGVFGAAGGIVFYAMASPYAFPSYSRAVGAAASATAGAVLGWLIGRLIEVLNNHERR